MKAIGIYYGAAAARRYGGHRKTLFDFEGAKAASPGRRAEARARR